MSWDAYTEYLVNDANVSAAAIVGYPDGGLWAKKDIELQGSEGADLAARFSNPLSGQKLIIGGVSYMATACNDMFLSGKKGQAGCVLTKSGKALIICLYEDGMNAGGCNNAASNMAADLTSKGF